MERSKILTRDREWSLRSTSPVAKVVAFGVDSRHVEVEVEGAVKLVVSLETFLGGRSVRKSTEIKCRWIQTVSPEERVESRE